MNAMNFKDFILEQEYYDDPSKSFEKLLNHSDEEIKDQLREVWKKGGGDNIKSSDEDKRKAYKEAEAVWQEHEKFKTQKDITTNMEEQLTSEKLSYVKPIEEYYNEGMKDKEFGANPDEQSDQTDEEQPEKTEKRTDLFGDENRGPDRQRKLEAIKDAAIGRRDLRSLTTAENLMIMSDHALDELLTLINSTKKKVKVTESVIVKKGEDGNTEIHIDDDKEDEIKMGKTPIVEPEDRRAAEQADLEENDKDARIISALIDLVRQYDIIKIDAPERHKNLLLVDDIEDINTDGYILTRDEDNTEIQIYPEDIEFVILPGNRKVSHNELYED